jgi:hypothetical protein
MLWLDELQLRHRSYFQDSGNKNPVEFLLPLGNVTFWSSPIVACIEKVNVDLKF